MHPYINQGTAAVATTYRGSFLVRRARLCLYSLEGATNIHMQVLVIVAASHLDAVTFQICSQSFKIMPTAFFAVWLLGQYLTPLQWGSLPVLAIGVVFVTMNGSTPAGETSERLSCPLSWLPKPSSVPQCQKDALQLHAITGFSLHGSQPFRGPVRGCSTPAEPLAFCERYPGVDFASCATADRLWLACAQVGAA